MSDVTTHRAYCSGCDREVTIGLLPAYEVVPGVPIDPAAVVCYDLGHACTGELCPLVGVETSAMRDRLERLPAAPDAVVTHADFLDLGVPRRD